jgi:NAD-dependent deacetylase
VVGTSALVYPAADLPRRAQRNGAYLIEINPEALTLTEQADWAVHAPAGAALLALLRALAASAGA